MFKLDNYNVGRHAEFMVVSFLDVFGWKSSLAPGSRGLFDIKSAKSNRKICTQVKYRTKPDYPFDSINDQKADMLNHSRRCACVPILAFITRMGDLLHTNQYSRHHEYKFLIMNRDNRLAWIQVGQDHIMQLINIRTGGILDTNDLA